MRIMCPHLPATKPVFGDGDQTWAPFVLRSLTARAAAFRARLRTVLGRATDRPGETPDPVPPVPTPPHGPTGPDSIREYGHRCAARRAEAGTGACTGSGVFIEPWEEPPP
jgi:hypothetical protein